MQSGSAIREAVLGAWRTAADAPSVRAALARCVAIGWATVELDRAVVELADALGLRGGEAAFHAAPRSVALGCTCRIAPGVLPDGGSLLALEPDTEGRLAGMLARLGEGPVVAWLASARRSTVLVALGAAGFTVSGERDGPLGPERLLVANLADGRQLLLVRRAAGTIRP